MDGVHHEFLFKNLTPEQQNQLMGLKTRFAKQQALLIKESGVMDFIHNISNSRGRALAVWERAYPNEVKKFRDGLSVLLDRSNNLFEVAIDTLSEMATARSVKNIDDYIKGANKIVSAFNKYENGSGGFKEYYNSILKPALLKMEEYNKINISPTQSNVPPAEFVRSTPSKPIFPIANNAVINKLLGILPCFSSNNSFSVRINFFTKVIFPLSKNTP
jgi:hypothetical protein